MNLPVWQAVLLGVLQGLTEFIPISSSAHLAIVQYHLPGFEQPGVLFDVVLHMGTLGAVVIYFASDLTDLIKNIFHRGVKQNEQAEDKLATPGWRLMGGIILASIPTAIIGLLLETRIEALFQSMNAVGAGLLATAVLLVLADLAAWKAGKRKPQDPGVLQSLLIGVAQGIAVIPGISRSGASISTGILAGVDGRSALRFSFLLLLPAAGGAMLLTALKHADEIAKFQANMVISYITGAAVALGVGYVCISLLELVVKRGRLSYFSIYCALLGLTVIYIGG
jgi:undecaprenyl-diphosphatase